MPMFTVTNRVDGTSVEYQQVWQRKTLLLVSVSPEDPTVDAYLESLLSHAPALRELTTALIVTDDAVPGIPQPGVVVADRWGEVYYLKEAADTAALPGPDELIEWLRFVQNECPECQGETR
jgi:hypothetical protein